MKLCCCLINIKIRIIIINVLANRLPGKQLTHNTCTMLSNIYFIPVIVTQVIVIVSADRRLMSNQ